MTNTIIRVFVLVTIFLVSMIGVQAATLTCQQVSSASMSVPQFSSSEIEIRCSASGGTVSNVQITPNANPASGLTIANSQTIVSTITNQNSSTAKWTVTGNSPNTYAVSYIISTDGTKAWTGASTTTVTVPSSAQLTVEYVLPPSMFTPTVETLDFRIDNIGGTRANNVKIRLNSTTFTGSKLSYPTTIAAGASASYSWTNLTGFNESGIYTTTVYIGSNMHDSATTAVNTPSANISQGSGWNLWSMTKTPTNMSPASVFSDINDNIIRVWGMTDAGWKRYTPGVTDQIGEMSVGYAYWVRLNESVALTLTGNDLVSTTINLTDGWNLRGFPSSQESLNVNTTVTSIVDNITIIWGYNNSVGTWKRFNPISYNPASSSHLHTFDRGSAYWYNVDGDLSLTFS